MLTTDNIVNMAITTTTTDIIIPAIAPGASSSDVPVLILGMSVVLAALVLGILLMVTLLDVKTNESK